MSWTNDLLVGLAGLLADGGAGAWSAAGAYPSDADTIIKISDYGGNSRGLITLTPFAVSDDLTLSDSVQGIQVRTRGDRDARTVDELDDKVFDLLHGLYAPALSTGVRVLSIWRNGGTPLGVDENGRHQRTSNYHAQCYRPSPNRT